MSGGANGSVRAVIDRAAKEHAQLEGWKDQFRLRGREFELFVAESPIPRCRRILEVGCGNGFTAALLAQSADVVVATDLPEENPETASPGLGAPSELLRALGIENCRLLACRGEGLPFADQSFDVVFSGYTLEHVPDPLAVLREIRRVLKPDGLLYLVLPTSMERATYLPAFYQYLWRRAWWYATKRGQDAVPAPTLAGGHAASHYESSEERGGGRGGANGTGGMSWRRFKQLHPHFPWPEPHGAYRHYLAEIVTYHPWRWRRLIQHAGVRIRTRFTTILFPYYVVGLFTDPFPWFARWSRVARRAQTWPGLRSLGHNVYFVAEKRS